MAFLCVSMYMLALYNTITQLCITRGEEREKRAKKEKKEKKKKKKFARLRELFATPGRRLLHI